jgi:hypothetical protein
MATSQATTISRCDFVFIPETAGLLVADPDFHPPMMGSCWARDRGDGSWLLGESTASATTLLPKAQIFWMAWLWTMKPATC